MPDGPVGGWWLEVNQFKIAKHHRNFNIFHRLDGLTVAGCILLGRNGVKVADVK